MKTKALVIVLTIAATTPAVADPPAPPRGVVVEVAAGPHLRGRHRSSWRCPPPWRQSAPSL